MDTKLIQAATADQRNPQSPDGKGAKLHDAQASAQLLQDSSPYTRQRNGHVTKPTC